MALTLSSLSSRDSFWVFDANGHACDGHCDPGFAMDSDGFWNCHHGSWRIVDEVPSVGRPHHGNVCPGNCPQHPLVDGLFRDLLRAEDMGLLWGDIMLAWEDAERARETPAQKAARLAKLDADEREWRARAAEAEKAKVEQVVAAMRKVEPSAKSRLPIHRHGLKPCRYFCQDGVLGKAAPAQRCPKTGTLWPAGCAPHLKKRCEFFHPDEPEWALIVAGKASQVAQTGGRDFSALKGAGGSGHRY